MQQPDINTMEMDISSLKNLTSVDILDILKDIDFLEVYYIGDKIIIQRKDFIKEEFHV